MHFEKKIDLLLEIVPILPYPKSEVELFYHEHSNLLILHLVGLYTLPAVARKYYQLKTIFFIEKVFDSLPYLKMR